MPYETTWRWTPIESDFPEYNCVPADYKGFEKIICKQLSNNLPVIMQIGITSEDMYLYNENKNPQTDIIDQYQYVRAQVYVKDENNDYILDKNRNRVTEDYDISKHYMTIDKFIIDDVTGSKWLQVETWGVYYYISFEEWMNSETGMFLAGGILEIEVTE